jgi:hypothetical protein
MSETINPAAAQPTSRQAFEQSDRNPQVTELGGRDANGGQISVPAASESRVTQPGAAASSSAGLEDKTES